MLGAPVAALDLGADAGAKAGDDGVVPGVPPVRVGPGVAPVGVFAPGLVVPGAGFGTVPTGVPPPAVVPAGGVSAGGVVETGIHWSINVAEVAPGARQHWQSPHV